MAGGISKGLGAAFIVIGVVALAVGIVLGVVMADDERENQRQIVPDEERSEQNEAGVYSGIALAIVGGAVGLLSIPFFVFGSSRAKKARQAHVERLAEATGSVVVAADAAPTAPARDGSPPTSPGRQSALVMALIVLLAVVIVQFALFVAPESPLKPTSEGFLPSFQGQGTMQGASAGAGTVFLAGPQHTSGWDLAVPYGSDHLEADLLFTPGDADPQELTWVLQRDAGNGWTDVVTAVGPSPVRLSWQSDDLDAYPLRLEARLTDGGTPGLDVWLEGRFWRLG